MFLSHVTLIDTLVYYYLENNAKQLCVRTHARTHTHACIFGLNMQLAQFTQTETTEDKHL